MQEVIKKITFNGISGWYPTLAPWIQALNDERVVREKAGFIFKAALSDDHLMLAVEPCLINGARSHHFNMRLAHEDVYTMIGNVDAQGVFTMLFRQESETFSDAECARYLEVCHAFASVLLACGYNGDGLLDDVTQGLLSTLGLASVPDRLAGLEKRDMAAPAVPPTKCDALL